MYLYQNNKACENLLLYIFKHDIRRKSAVQLLLFFVVKRRKKTMQWSHVKTFEFVLNCFYCLTSIFVLFCFCETNFVVFTIFAQLSGLKEMYFSWKYNNKKQNMQFLCKKEEEKNYILTDYKRSYFRSYSPNFSLILSANMY